MALEVMRRSRGLPEPDNTYYGLTIECVKQAVNLAELMESIILDSTKSHWRGCPEYCDPSYYQDCCPKRH